ncbi:MAG: BatA domain-containing protein [Candidatus Latescibacterota bacterium]|nr:BatA domain-containing protein [Candidatus Latescibacterota bacterium]
MQFLNPLALIGLAAAVIPLALHLLNRGRPRAVPFSNLPFLRQLHQSRMRSVRMRQWWVLLLRTLALLLLALVFARPALRNSSDDWFASAQPTTAVLLIDQSYSTTARVGSESVFAQLRRRAKQVLDLFEDRDRLILIGFADQAGEPSTASRSRLRQQLDDLTPGQGATNLARALTRAYQVLSQSEGRERELYVLTDMTRPGWHPPAVAPPTGLRTFVLPPGQQPRSNHALVNVVHEPWLTSPGERVDLAVDVQFHGPHPVTSLAVDLYVGGERVQRRAIDLNSLQRDGDMAHVSVPFSIAPRRGGRLRAFAQIDADAVAADDRFHFIIDAPDSVRILLLGESSTATYYPRRALTAAAEGDRSLHLRTLRFSEATDDDWHNADVVILADVEYLQEADLQRLRRRAENRGGIILFPGPDAQIQHLNREILPALMPVSLAGARGQVGRTSTLLDTSDLHGALFGGLDRRQAPSTSLSYELVVEPVVRVLARFDDERPALVEGTMGHGRVVLWSMPLDLSWSQWPESGWFLPLLQRLTRHVALGGVAERGYLVGEHAWRRLPGVATDSRVQAQAPSGQRRFVDTEHVLGESRWKITALSEAGFWSLRTDDDGPDRAGTDDTRSFAVNVDPAEADLGPVDDDTVSRVLGDAALVLDEQTPLAATVTHFRVGREIWRELLILAGVLLMLELWISRAPAARGAAED